MEAAEMLQAYITSSTIKPGSGSGLAGHIRRSDSSSEDADQFLSASVPLDIYRKSVAQHNGYIALFPSRYAVLFPCHQYQRSPFSLTGRIRGLLLPHAASRRSVGRRRRLTGHHPPLSAECPGQVCDPIPWATWRNSGFGASSGVRPFHIYVSSCGFTSPSIE